MSVDQLTPERAAALPGPDWLCAQRAEAAERFSTTALPDTSLEEWRYSRVEQLDLAAYTVEGADHVAVPASATALGESLGRSAGTIVLHNGRVASVTLEGHLSEKGVRFGLLADSAVAVGGLSGGTDPFGDLTLAQGPDPLLLAVPRGVAVEVPFHLIHVIDGEGSLVLPRLVIDAAENSELSLVEWATSGNVEALVVPRTEISVGNAARVRMVSVNAWGSATNQLAAVSATVGQEATLRMSHVALGGDYARSRFDCRLVGRGATGQLSALYLGDGDQMHDLRTFQTHEARDTTSELLFKGALDDRARAVYTGMIRVDHEGRGSNADQTNRVIKLSDEAWAESVPNLEINHNDVKCSHATAVGPIDDDQRFYLESRGVPPETAERLVVNGFFEEVLDTIAVPEVVAVVRPLIAAKLGAVGGGS